MAAAANLQQAAKQAWDNLIPLQIAGTLRAQLLSFVSAIVDTFPQATPGNHPTANWIAVLWAFAYNATNPTMTWPELRVAADYVYRLCFMTDQAQTDSLISAAQAAVVLAAYNAEF